MKQISVILAFLPAIVFAQGRLPTFPSTYQWKLPEQGYLHSKVKSIDFVETTFFSDTSSLKLIYKIFYKKNRIVSANFIDDKDDSAFMIHYFDKYFRLKKQVRQSNNFIKMITYSYDEKNLKSTEIIFDRDQSVSFKNEVYYYAQYKPMKKIEYDNDNIVKCFWIYKYNSFGDLIENIFVNMPDGHGVLLDSSITGGPEKFYSEPNDTTTYSFSYDTLKRPLTKTEFNSSKRKTRTEYTYSKDSTIVKTIHYFNTKTRQAPSQIEYLINYDTTKIYKTQYLDNLDSTKVVSESFLLYINDDLKEYSRKDKYSQKRILYNTIYQYDVYENWIKKTSYENGILKKEIVREIKY